MRYAKAVRPGAEHSHEVAIRVSKILEEFCDDCVVATLVRLVGIVERRSLFAAIGVHDESTDRNEV